jgi:predicted PurR-regulated permease PerM
MPDNDPKMTRNIELALRIAALFLVLYWVIQILAPFIPAIAWGVIIAVACFPAYRWLLQRLDGRTGLTATLFTLLLLVVLIVPAVWLGKNLVVWGADIAGRLNDGTLDIPPPPDRVASWPIIGERVHDAWALASTNLSAALKTAESQVRTVVLWLLGAGASVSKDVLQFALSILIAGVFLAKAEGAAGFARKFFNRFIPATDWDFAAMSEQTIRSVAVGVIGVALIQAALIGVALLAIDVPGAAILIIATVLLGIIQLPATLITIPIIIWVWGAHETLTAAIFSAYIIPAGLADNVLKPLLLGRGSDAPMLVIFIGAIGGFVTSGIIGLFIGAVIMVLAYELFNAWLNVGNKSEEEPASAEDVAKP